MAHVHEYDDPDAEIARATADFTAQWKILEASEAYFHYYGSDLEKLQEGLFDLIRDTPARTLAALARKARIALMTESDDLMVALARDAAAMG